ncbi:hypothetical protein EBN03_25590 [Nocardia stercoris]|uniref:DUF4262 domain-containing protein n=2 Tax=Nocardia stercoris TaxID=2483361 RepID=A0A3M2L4K9_9NOCA|nr:hypothetical protein EBN03_25590 [Nocardia stercoris]
MDPAERQIRTYNCKCCDVPVNWTWNFVSRDGSTHAAYYANSYHHIGQPHETWIDVILGTWGQSQFDDHVTFGCRVGPTTNSAEPGATLVQACLDGSGGPMHGTLLSREAALTHPRLQDFWSVVDFVLANDPTVNAHLYGPASVRGHEVQRGIPWPYPEGVFPQHLGMIVQRTIMAGTEPVRVVTHWADGDWTVADGVNDPNGNAGIACVEHLLAADETFTTLASMPPGTQAFRSNPGEPWTFEAHTYDE